jgi:hypothetical protein
MTNTTPPDWVLFEAAKRSGLSYAYGTADYYHDNHVYAALCDMIAKHEKPPVDRKMLCAKEAMRFGKNFLNQAQLCVHAITLWEEGFGK